MSGETPAGIIQQRMRQLPLADLDTVAPGTSLVLAPHPDDETLGCGGLIIQSCARGRPPLIVVATDGSASHPSYPADRLAALRAEELQTAAGILGVAPERVHFLGLQDSRAPHDGPEFARAVQTVAGLIRAHAIDTVLASWLHDPHGDHQASAAIADAATRITGARLLYYPIWGWLLPADHMLPIDAVRGMRLRVASERPQKRRALAAHASQYSAMLADDPSGFRLPTDLLAATDRDDEVFLLA